MLNRALTVLKQGVNSPKITTIMKQKKSCVCGLKDDWGSHPIHEVQSWNGVLTVLK